ncbi:MAG: SIMPL domain-containing protein [Anaerolineae bacterium]|jgi:hypothetical protein|nr:SIMPL domain-containing protein [Anaerolineae bacterium]
MLRKYVTILIISIAALSLVAAPALAQSPAPAGRTITVTGNGSAAGVPDTANVTLGVEVADASIQTAFAQTNERIASVIAAVVAAGVPAENIQTAGLSIYQEMLPSPMGDGSTGDTRYRVSNQVQVTVRDVNLVAGVINAAVEAGANSLYGLDFVIRDSAAQEQQAREQAFQDARARATALAALAGVSLGDVVSITEVSGGYFGPNNQALGGSGAVIQPGLRQVALSLQVTFAIGQ